MKKEIFLPCVAWLSGIAGFALRFWELETAYDPQMHLLRAGSPAGWLLWLLMAFVLVLAVLACRGMDKTVRQPEQWLYAPTTGYIMLVVCAGFVLMAAALAGLKEQGGLRTKETMPMLTYGLYLVGGVAVLLAGRCSYRGLWSKQTPIAHMAVAFCALVWLVAEYQSNARQADTGLFVWRILSLIAIVLALYGIVTLAMGKGGAGRTCVYSLMAISLSGAALADGQSLAFALGYLFALIYLTAQSWMLLRGAFGEPWPQRMPQGADGEEQADAEE